MNPLRRLRWKARLGDKEVRRERSSLALSAARGQNPWYAQGVLTVHYALNLTTQVSLCLRPTHGTSNTRSGSPLTCRTCTRLWDAAKDDLRTHPSVIHRPLVSRRRRDRDGDMLEFCAGCAQVGLKAAEQHAPWPCPFVSLTPPMLRQHQMVLDTVASLALRRDQVATPVRGHRLRQALRDNPSLHGLTPSYRRAIALARHMEATSTTATINELLTRLQHYASWRLRAITDAARENHQGSLLDAQARRTLFRAIRDDGLLLDTHDPLVERVVGLLDEAEVCERDGEVAVMPTWDDLGRLVTATDLEAPVKAAVEVP